MNRFQRKETMWAIEGKVLGELQKIPGLRFPAVFDYGATPLSTIRSTVDLMITGPVTAAVHSPFARTCRSG